MKPTPKDCLKVNIARWEGLYQAMPGDPGNWIEGRLVGTMRGVTPNVLAAHRGLSLSAVTAEVMKSVTLDEAAEIGVSRFYTGTGLDKLEWGPATDVLVDFGWGSGPGQAVKSCERMLGRNPPDYQLDATTVKLWGDAIADAGWEHMILRVFRMREAFYDLICNNNPTLLQFRQGWHNRASWMLPGSGEWWQHWTGYMSPQIAVSEGVKQQQNPTTRVLSKGSFGEEVRALQIMLVKAGYPLPTGVDGRFGDETEAAVLAFQRAAGITVDGWAGTETITALAGAPVINDLSRPVPPVVVALPGSEVPVLPPAPPPPVPTFWEALGSILRRIF